MTTKTLFLLAGASLGLSSMAALAQEPVSRDDIRAMIAEQLADAETRSSLLQGGGGAGYDKNFGIWSADGNYRLNVSGFMQIRYTANFRDSNNILSGTNGDETNLGFSIRQAKIRFSGNVVNPDLKFAVQIATELGEGNESNFNQTSPLTPSGVRNSGLFFLDDAMVSYNLGNNWSVYGGQFKLRFMKEKSNATVYTMAAERSVVDAVFGQGRSQGVGAMYKADQWNWSLEFSDGLNSQNTDFNSLREHDFAVTSAFEYRFCGTDEQLKDYTSLPGDQMGANIGAAVHYQLANNDPAGAPRFSTFNWTVNGQVEGGGWSLFAAAVGQHAVESYGAGGLPTDASNYGWSVQGAWRFMANDELFCRYDGLWIDRVFLSAGRQDFHFLTIGYNHYFAGHAAKFTADCIIGLVTDGSLIDYLGGGSLGTTNFSLGNQDLTQIGLLGVGKNTEAALRFQFQLMF